MQITFKQKNSFPKVVKPLVDLFKNKAGIFLIVSSIALLSAQLVLAEKKYVINESSSSYINKTIWGSTPGAGDTIFISSERTKGIKFKEMEGDENNPIVVINYGGQVKVDNPDGWGAIEFLDCKYIKITGDGHPGFKYGFHLSAKSCGLAFSGLSSNCEAGFVKVSHQGFFGIMAKKDYHGNPPSPVPVFEDLHIHDCFVENVSEGMYLGETKSPGMEFKHVRIYNNIVRNTKRECIQIANMVEDVEIYNNTLLNGGSDGLGHQGSNLQVGDNTVSKVYNNIMIGASTYGIACYGMGDNYFYNNYLSTCKGIFVDNRLFSMNDSLIVFSGNYFTDINNTENEIIRNMNGENYLLVQGNYYDDETALLYRNYYSSYTNYKLEGNTVSIIKSLQFTNEEENDYSVASTNPTEYMNLGAPGGPEYFEYEEELIPETTEAEQIVLNALMIEDEVSGGSLYSPSFLVDEQEATPDNQLHPISKSWKPYWNMNNGPFHIYIDLGKVYNITEIALHDMHNIQPLDISVGEPGNWELLFTESCDKYKAWKEHGVNISTRYIRLSMNENVSASVNEIILYGFAEEEIIQEKSGSISQNNYVQEEEEIQDVQEIQDLFLVKNPVVDNLELYMPHELNENFRIEVYSLNGGRMFERNYVQNNSSLFEINMSEKSMKEGMYVLRYSNSEGYTKTIKFIKNDF